MEVRRDPDGPGAVGIMRRPDWAGTIDAIPPSLWCVYGRDARGGIHLTKEARAWKDHAQWRLNTQRPPAPFHGPLAVKVTFHVVPSWNPRWDLDNRLKLLFDVLTSNVWADDSQVETMLVRRTRTTGAGESVSLALWRLAGTEMAGGGGELCLSFS